MKWTIRKKIRLNGRIVEVEVPNPKIPREKALEEFKKVIKEIIRGKSASIPRKL